MSGRLAGVALQICALMLFVCLDTLIKLLTAHFAVAQLMFVRFVFHILVLGPAIWLATGSLPLRSRAPGLQALRSLTLAVANFMFSNALAHIPLADATAVGFASPVLTVALASLWLRERVSPRRWCGVVVGLVGVMVALRPPFLTGAAPPHWAYLLPLGMAVVYALYQILTRKLAAVDDPRTTILHTGFAAAIATSLAQPFVWEWPSAGMWGVFVLLGVLGGGGHFLLVLAFARAPASLLAPMSYTQLIWAALAGVLVFGDLPDGWTVLGAAIIAAGGILVALPERPSS
jgi:drug/metabolite transporter (DMT)-like permease